MQPLISVITPAYNAAKYIARSIESVIHQSFTDWELIIVDDGSTDNTKSIAQSYCELDSRIKYVFQENGKQGKARNTGLALARGTFLAFLDADDVWLPEKLSVQTRQMQSSKADLIFSNSFIFSKNEEIEGDTKQLEKCNVATGLYRSEAGVSSFLARNHISILTVLVKKNAILKAGGFTEDRAIQNAEDYHLWLKLLMEGFTFFGFEDVLAAYRKHEESVSDKSGANLEQVIQAKLNLVKIYPAWDKHIMSSLPKTLGNSLGVISKYNPDKFYSSIDHYLRLANKEEWSIFFKSCELLNTKKLALRSFFFIMNYL